MLKDLEAVLRRGRNADGGWPYCAGKRSRLEPTCWALLALADADRSVLRTWPAHDGLLLEQRDGQPNYGFQGLALLTLLTRKIEHERGNASLLAGVQRTHGEPLPKSTINRQDNSLQGWSWIAGTFSWVEPTAWCLLALKKWRAAGAAIEHKRVADAEALLVDRCCTGGGWNYGNSNMLGQELPAYVPTTALALMALQDRQSEQAFRSSRDYLTRDALSEPSSVALSLALIALRVLSVPTEHVQAALLGKLPTAIALGNHLAIALALVALKTDHSDAAFAL